MCFLGFQYKVNMTVIYPSVHYCIIMYVAMLNYKYVGIAGIILYLYLSMYTQLIWW